VEATYAGLRRGPGSWRTEVLNGFLGFLRSPKSHIRPIWKLPQDRFVELQQELEWWQLTPYVTTGQHNPYPRTAIALLAGANKNNYVDFCDKITGGSVRAVRELLLALEFIGLSNHSEVRRV